MCHLSGMSYFRLYTSDRPVALNCWSMQISLKPYFKSASVLYFQYFFFFLSFIIISSSSSISIIISIIGWRKGSAHCGFLGMSQQPVIFSVSSFAELQNQTERHLPALGWPLMGKQRASMEVGEPLSLLSPVSCPPCPGGCCFSSPYTWGTSGIWGHFQMWIQG